MVTQNQPSSLSEEPYFMVFPLEMPYSGSNLTLPPLKHYPLPTPLTIYTDYSSRNYDLYHTLLGHVYIWDYPPLISSPIISLHQHVGLTFFYTQPTWRQEQKWVQTLRLYRSFDLVYRAHEKNWYTSPADEWYGFIHTNLNRISLWVGLFYGRCLHSSSKPLIPLPYDCICDVWVQNRRPCEKVKEILKPDQIHIGIYFNLSLRLVLEFNVSGKLISLPSLHVKA